MYLEMFDLSRTKSDTCSHTSAGLSNRVLATITTHETWLQN